MGAQQTFQYPQLPGQQRPDVDPATQKMQMVTALADSLGGLLKTVKEPLKIPAPPLGLDPERAAAIQSRYIANAQMERQRALDELSKIVTMQNVRASQERIAAGRLGQALNVSAEQRARDKYAWEQQYRMAPEEAAGFEAQAAAERAAAIEETMRRVDPLRGAMGVGRDVIRGGPEGIETIYQASAPPGVPRRPFGETKLGVGPDGTPWFVRVTYDDFGRVANTEPVVKAAETGGAADRTPRELINNAWESAFKEAKERYPYKPLSTDDPAALAQERYDPIEARQTQTGIFISRVHGLLVNGLATPRDIASYGSRINLHFTYHSGDETVSGNPIFVANDVETGETYPLIFTRGDMLKSAARKMLREKVEEHKRTGKYLLPSTPPAVINPPTPQAAPPRYQPTRPLVPPMPSSMIMPGGH